MKRVVDASKVVAPAPRHSLDWQAARWQAAVAVAGGAVVVRVGRLDARLVRTGCKVKVVELCLVQVLRGRIWGRRAALQVREPPGLVRRKERRSIRQRQRRARLPALCRGVCTGNPVEKAMKNDGCPWLRVQDVLEAAKP